MRKRHTFLFTGLAAAALTLGVALPNGDAEAANARQTVSFGPWDPGNWFIPNRTGGDPDFHGHGPCMSIKTGSPTLKGFDRILIPLYIHGVECHSDRRRQSDYTEVQHTWDLEWDLDLDPCWVVDTVKGKPKVSGATKADIFYRDTDHSTDRPAANGIIRSLSCVGDTKGNEAGTRTGCKVTFDGISVQVVQLTRQQCLSGKYKTRLP